MKRLCRPSRNEILCPITIEVDETYLDNHGRLSICPVNIKCCLFNVETNRKEEASSTLFYLPNDEAEAAHHKLPTLPVHKAQNLHNALREGFKDLRHLMDNKTGVPWKIFYGGKEHQVNLRFAIANIISDTAMHDKICGHFGIRNWNVNYICRHCKCPTQQLTDSESFLEHPLFTPQELDPSLQAHQPPQYWQSLSHHPVKNALDELEYGVNKYKCHLCTCGEVLHMHQKGAMTRYIESFVYKWKEGSRLSLDNIAAAEKQKNINSSLENMNFLTLLIGTILTRQSDRDKPRTKFKNSVFRTTKKCAHEQGGILLSLLVAMLTDRGRQIFLGERTMSEEFLENEVTIVELILMMEVWLKKSEYPAEHVLDAERLGKAIGHYMYLLTSICSREGMGNLLVKNHLVLHLPEYIQRWGPPRVHDSSVLERSHKTQAKRPGELTQRRPGTFISQLAHRYTELRLLKRMQNFSGTEELMSQTYHGGVKQKSVTLAGEVCTGSSFKLGFASQLSSKPGIQWTLNPGRQAHLQDAINFVAEVVLPKTRMEFVSGFTDYKKSIRGAVEIFRAHPSFRSASQQQRDVWYDWALFDLEDQGYGKKPRPGQIVMFLQVPELLDEVRYKRIRLKPTKPHAVVRLFDNPPSDRFRSGQIDSRSRRIVPYSSLVTFGRVASGFHLIPCEYIVDTALVIPNMPTELPKQQPANRASKKAQEMQDKTIAALGQGYFLVRHRREWGDAFGKLIESFEPSST